MSSSFDSADTIAAIATAVAAGQGGIAIVRISGPSALVVAQGVVSVSGKQSWLSHHVLYGHVVDGSGKGWIDEVLVLFMRAPRSFTAEDVVEIHCHGGLIVVQQVLERVLAQPSVRRALPGEFSQRAVLNGRLDLTRAEAISDLVAARSRKAAQVAMAGVDGGIQRKILAFRERLIDCLSELEARVDFEDELPTLDANQLLQEIFNVREELIALIEDADQGAMLRNGLKVALIGRPNVGKSSLLNRLSRCERAIVTDLPGTTRDLLETEIILQGIPITLLDTAGIRETEDPLEKLGIIRSQQALIAADIVVMIFDLNIGWTDEDQILFEQIPRDVPLLCVGNKVDVVNQLKFIKPNEMVPDVFISARTGKGENDFVQALLKACGANDSQSVVVALNERQKYLAENASVALGRLQGALDQKLPWDFWTIDLRQAIHSLGEITGEDVTEAVLDRIFSRFCIGK